ncbi:MAG: hypothetical protein R2867_13075 [Caldilineaceae bacterium]
MQVNADGSLGSWTEMEPMTTKRAWLAAVTVNDYIYAIGGVSEPGPGALTTVERTKINDDGTLSPWETVSPLVMSRFNHTAVLVGPYIYAIGGIGSGDIKTIQRAQIYADGTLSDWKATSSITDERQEGMSIAHQGYVYSFAGFTTTGAHNQFVERAKYDTEGNLGKWEQVNPFYYSRSAGAAVVKGDYLYVIGGSRLQNDTIVAQSVEWVNLSTLDLPFENGISINNGALLYQSNWCNPQH